MTESEWLNIFGNNLLEMMREYGYTQDTLARETGLSKSTISKYINKQQIPRASALINIANVFGCNIDDLVYYGDKIDI